MKEYWEVPEAAGPQSEGTLNNVQYGDPGYPSIGAIPPVMSAEQRDRERAEDERRWQVRQAAERAAIAAGQSALEAASTADRLIREAQETARKVSGS